MTAPIALAAAIQAEIAIAAIPDDERIGVPQAHDDDVWSKIEMCRSHYADVALGAEYTDQFTR